MEIMKEYREAGVSDEVYAFGEKIAEELKERFEEIDRMAEYNQCKVLNAMRNN